MPCYNGQIRVGPSDLEKTKDQWSISFGTFPENWKSRIQNSVDYQEISYNFSTVGMILTTVKSYQTENKKVDKNIADHLVQYQGYYLV